MFNHSLLQLIIFCILLTFQNCRGLRRSLFIFLCAAVARDNTWIFFSIPWTVFKLNSFISFGYNGLEHYIIVVHFSFLIFFRRTQSTYSCSRPWPIHTTWDHNRWCNWWGIWQDSKMAWSWFEEEWWASYRGACSRGWCRINQILCKLFSGAFYPHSGNFWPNVYPKFLRCINF